MSSNQIKTKKFKSNTLLLKSGLIIVITMILLYPSSRINDLIADRQITKESTINEIGEKWGKHQTLVGPILTIPYLEEFISYQNGEKNVSTSKKQLHILPEQLSINSEINPETLKRGIFDVAVFDSQSTLSGSFESLSVKQLGIEEQNLLLDEAFLTIGISDLRGIQDQVLLQWDNAELNFQSGTYINDRQLISSGIMAIVPISISDGELVRSEFNINLNLKGSEQMYFTPVGRVTNLAMNSSWASPSFNGEYLPIPDSKNISSEGFSAEWRIIDLNRNFPQAWYNEKHDVQKSAFGVDLFIPADNYQRSERSIKYAILFIGLTFMVFFLTEIINNTSIHPVQYLLIGSGLVLFFILLVSISEHLTFNWAYVISSGLILVLIGFYTQSVFRSRKFSLMLTSILTTMYFFIFVIIQMENFALLSGSLGLFIILASVMYYSRKIDWYSMKNVINI